MPDCHRTVITYLRTVNIPPKCLLSHAYEIDGSTNVLAPFHSDTLKDKGVHLPSDCH